MPIVDKAMRGNHTIRKYLADYLSAEMPLYTDILREQNSDLNDIVFPDPVKYDSMNPMTASAYPVVGSYSNSTDTFIRTDSKPSGALEYDARYDTTIFVCAKTPLLGTDEAGLPKYAHPERDAAVSLRDDLMAALRSALLNKPSLGTAGFENRAYLQEDTMREAYPEPYQISNSHLFLCSGIINVTINLIETTVVPTIGTVLNKDVIIDVLPIGE